MKRTFATRAFLELTQRRSQRKHYRAVAPPLKHANKPLQQKKFGRDNLRSQEPLSTHMTRSLEEANDLSDLDARVLREIHTDGWQITGVLAREQEHGPDFAYSIGFFHTMEHPEVILFGLPLKTCMNVVNAIGMEIQGGRRFEPGRNYQGFVNFPYLCCFRELDRNSYSEHVGYALWFYESDPFPMLQCFWSDHRGLFPWDEKCSPYARDAQPLHLLAHPACGL